MKRTHHAKCRKPTETDPRKDTEVEPQTRRTMENNHDHIDPEILAMREQLSKDGKAEIPLPWGTYRAEVKETGEGVNITPTWEPVAVAWQLIVRTALTVPSITLKTHLSVQSLTRMSSQ